MFFHTLQIYRNVINEHHVHEEHEVCRRIRQPKGHNNILKETISCSEGCLGYIFGTNFDLVIAGVEINLGEHLGFR
jgi:hypothetical protein